MKPLSGFLLAFLLAATSGAHAQSGIRDTSITLVPLTISYAYQTPGDAHLGFGFFLLVDQVDSSNP